MGAGCKENAHALVEQPLSAKELSGQWRLSVVELANWGSFCGYHRFPVSRNGMLITGDSGSGKSTILDAIAAVLTPPRDLRLNAAASTDVRRGGGSRTLVSYIRGACGAYSAEGGEVRTSYLRGRIATWSGVLLRFDQGVKEKEPVNLVAVYFQKANSNDAKDTVLFYAKVNGDLSLSELERFGVAGADMSAFNKAFSGRGKGQRHHSSFCASFCSTLGIAGPETLTLLHKIQAAKDMGSLDGLFRNYMLERPKTFQLAEEAVEQFGELEQAHGRVVDQKEQMLALEPLEGLLEKHQRARTEEGRSRELSNALSGFVEEEVVAILEERRREQLSKRDSLRQELDRLQQELSFSQKAYDRANEALTAQNGGSTLASADLECLNAQKCLDDVERSRKRLMKTLNEAAKNLPFVEDLRLDLSPPFTLAQFEGLKCRIEELSQDMRLWIEAHAHEKVERYGALQQLRKQEQGYREELRHLGVCASNIPRKLHEVRVEIADYVGVAISDLPFCGELIDVPAEHGSWHGAIERVLHSFAITLLVERAYASAVAEYLEGRHLGLRFEYDVVPDTSSIEVPQRSLNDRSLLRKLSVAESSAHPAYSRWIHKRLRDRYDYRCVDTTADLVQASKAITRGGQVKNKAHYVKDDRFRVGDASGWVLGSINDGKIAELQRKIQDITKEGETALAAVRHYDEGERRANAVVALADRLAEEDWSVYDIEAAKDRLEKARSFFEMLKSDPALADLEAKRADARERLDAATESRNDCDGRLRAVLEGIGITEMDIATRRKRAVACETTLSDEELSELRLLFASTVQGYRESVESMYATQSRVQEKLRRDIEGQQQVQQEARRRAEKLMQHYKERWASESADLSTDFVDAEAYVKRCRRIKASGLPEYEQQFLAVLNDFSQDQVTAIASEIRNAFRDIRDKLEPVNRSLLLSEFSPGVNLRIEVQEHKTARVREFLSDLKEIASKSWTVDDAANAYKRYEKTASVMRKLGAKDYASATWKQQCLDTRSHVRFVAQEVNSCGEVVNVHSNDGGLSGGERQKLVLFCLAAALRYQLADEDSTVPSYGTIILDEAFDKSDRTFAKDTLLVFERFGFHMLLVTPNKLIQLLEDHIGSIGLVNRTADQRSHIRVIPFDDSEEAGRGIG